jgi:FG-GAP-like repeat/Abnormal spindle-like microcephaly-assoc'd, ASPM-SPD-2-Hydin
MRLNLVALSVVILLATALFAQSNPVPFVNQPLVPAVVTPGSPGFTLTVNGTGFVSGSVVRWNGSPRTTAFINASQLTASIAAADVAVASTATITVASPTPGGGVSNLAALPIALPRSTLSFSASSMKAGTGTSSARVADLNGDGNTDIVAVNTTSNTVSIFLGNGDGTFRPQVNYATGADPTDVTVADFNGDGKLDLAVANDSGLANSVSILLGNGDGTFRPHVDYAAGGQPFSLVAADFNGDGKIDLVVANNISGGGISVLLGNGDGTFKPYAFYEDFGYQTYGVAVGDFNHDGILDVVAPNSSGNSVSLFLGKGDGTFQPHVDFPIAGDAFGLAVADFDSDGNLDLAVSNYQLNTVSILLGRGDGTFQPQVQYTVAPGPSDIAAVDVNGDGRIDLAVATGLPTASVSVLLGNGDGTFQPHVDFPSLGLGGISAGDFNNDGLIDFTGSGSGGVTALIQDFGTEVVLSPTTVNFATQLVGTVSSAQTVKLTNSGSSAFSITSMSVATPNFAVVSKCGRSVQAGQSCNLLLYFTPTASGNLTDTLSIYDTGGGSPQLVSLSGAGTSLYWSPKFLNFGAITVRKMSSPQKITLTNEGSVRLSISQITIAGTNKGDFTQVNACGTSLVAGASCTIDVWFTPQATGSRSATLSIADNGGGSPQKVNLIGIGQ